MFQHMGRLAKYHISLGLDTIAALRKIVSLCARVVTHPVLVDRIACMLNYFLARLVGPKSSELRVRDKSTYGFKPELFVREICETYAILGLDKGGDTVAGMYFSNHSNAAPPSLDPSPTVQAFRRAVVSDGRSYTKDLLSQALNVLNRVSPDASLIQRFDDVSKALQVTSLTYILPRYVYHLCICIHSYMSGFRLKV